MMPPPGPFSGYRSTALPSSFPPAPTSTTAANLTSNDHASPRFNHSSGLHQLHVQHPTTNGSNLPNTTAPSRTTTSSTRFPPPKPASGNPQPIQRSPPISTFSSDLLESQPTYVPPPSAQPRRDREREYPPPLPQHQQQQQSRAPSLMGTGNNGNGRESTHGYGHGPPPMSQSQSYKQFHNDSQPEIFPESQSQLESQPHTQPHQQTHNQGDQKQWPRGVVDRYVPTHALRQYAGGRPAQSVAGSGSLRVDRGGGGLTSRSTAGGVSGGGGVSQMSGVEVYMQNTLGGGKAGKGEQILNVVTDSLLDKMDSLENDNRILRDHLHELRLGQKALATREEMTEEVTAQLSPALHEFFQSLQETLRTSLAPVPEHTAKLSAEKVRTVIVELNEVAKAEHLKESMRESDSQRAAEKPLMALLDHLITKLAPLDDLNTTLISFKDLPRAIQDVAVFKSCLDAMQNRIANASPPQQAAIQSIPESPKWNSSVVLLEKSVQDLGRKITTLTPSSHSSGEINKILIELLEIKRIMGSQQQVSQAPPPPLPIPIERGIDSEDFANMLELVGSLNKQVGLFMEEQSQSKANPAQDQLDRLEKKMDEILQAQRKTPIMQATPAFTPQTAFKSFPTPITGAQPAAFSFRTTRPFSDQRIPLQPMPQAQPTIQRHQSSQPTYKATHTQSKPPSVSGKDVFGPVDHFAPLQQPPPQLVPQQTKQGVDPPSVGGGIELADSDPATAKSTDSKGKRKSAPKKPRLNSAAARRFTRAASTQAKKDLSYVIDITSDNSGDTGGGSHDSSMANQGAIAADSGLKASGAAAGDAPEATQSDPLSVPVPDTLLPDDSLLGSGTLGKQSIPNAHSADNMDEQGKSTAIPGSASSNTIIPDTYQTEDYQTLPPPAPSRMGPVKSYGSGVGSGSGSGTGAGIGGGPMGSSRSGNVATGSRGATGSVLKRKASLQGWSSDDE